MSTIKIRPKLEELGIEVEQIADERIRKAIYLLYNLLEELASANSNLQEENQKLRDEINNLKGEQGKPKINPQARDKNRTEKNRIKRRKRKLLKRQKLKEAKSKKTKSLQS